MKKCLLLGKLKFWYEYFLKFSHSNEEEEWGTIHTFTYFGKKTEDQLSSFPRMTIFLCLDNGPKICLTRRISSYEKNRMAAGSSSVFRDPNHIKFKVIMWSIKIPRPKNEGKPCK